MIAFIAIFNINVDTASAFSLPVKGYGELHEDKNGKVLWSNYYLDSVSESEVEDNNFFVGFLKSLDLTEKVGSWIASIFNYFANAMMTVNIYLTKAMILTFDFAYENSLINSLLAGVESKVKAISGVSGIGFGKDGLFPNLITFIALFSAVYGLFLFFWKRTILASLETVVKTTIVLAVSILFFSNFSFYLNGAHVISKEITSFVLTGGELGGKAQERALDEINGMLWEQFVDSPYIYAQFGAGSLEELKGGESRVRAFLDLRSDSISERNELLKEEYERGNTAILDTSVINKIAFLPIVLMTNGIVSIPIYVLSFAFLFFQFWFVIMASIGPFALLIGAIPGQFGVFKRYFVELLIPLGLQIGISFITLILMTLSEVSRNFFISQAPGNEDSLTTIILRYITLLIVQFVLFASIFMLKNRIQSLFFSGSKLMKEMGKTVQDTSKKIASTGGAVAGATVGAGAVVATGGAGAGAMAIGAMKGANLGSEIGKASVGESSIGDIAQAGLSAKRTADLSKLTNFMQGNDDNVSLGGESKDIESYSDSDAELTPEQENKKMEQEALEEEGLQAIKDYAEENDYDEKQYEKLKSYLEDEDVDLSRVTPESLEEARKETEEFEGVVGLNYDKILAKKLKENQMEEIQLEAELRQTRNEELDEFMSNRNMNQAEKNRVYRYLDEKAIDMKDLQEDDFEIVDQEVRKRMSDGEKIDYTDEFSKGLADIVREREDEKARQRIISSFND